MAIKQMEVSAPLKLKPLTGYRDLLKVPMPLAAAHPLLQHIREDTWAELHKRVERDGVAQEVGILSLYATQNHVSNVVLKPKITHKADTPLLVVEINGLKVLLDGTHRCVIALLAGKRKILADVWSVTVKATAPMDHKQILAFNRKLQVLAGRT